MGVFPTVSRIVSTIGGGPGALVACGVVRDSVSAVFFGIISGLGVGTRDAKSYDATVPGCAGQAGNWTTGRRGRWRNAAGVPLGAGGHRFQEGFDVPEHFLEIVGLGDEPVCPHLHREELVPFL